MTTRRAFIGVSLSLFLLISLNGRRAGAQDCEGCERRAAMAEADAGPTAVELRASLRSRLAEVLTSPCFHLIRTDVEPPDAWPERQRWMSKYHPPEYVFTAKYEEGLNLTDQAGAAIMSRLTIGLLYDGEPRELVGAWTVTSPVDSYTSCTNRMFKNEDAVMKSVRPIEALLGDFERRPTQCRLELLHQATGLGAGQEWELEIGGFKDVQSRDSKAFNRIVVRAEQGEILNGAPCDDDPRARVFQVGDAQLQVKYKAPDKKGVTRDTISVYNSCEISPATKWPFSKTSKKDKIAEKPIPIIRGDYTLNILFDKSWNYQDPSSGNRREGAFTVQISGPLTMLKESRHPMPMFAPAGLTAQWSYRGKTIELNPKPGCPELLSEYQGAGAHPVRNVAPMALILHYFKNLGQAAGQLASLGIVDYYELMLQPADVESLVVPGRYRSGPPNCQDYRDSSIKASEFSLTLRCKMSRDDVLSGSQTWTSQRDSGSIEVSDLPPVFNERPHSPHAPGDRFRYSITWKITKTRGD